MLFGQGLKFSRTMCVAAAIAVAGVPLAGCQSLFGSADNHSSVTSHQSKKNQHSPSSRSSAKKPQPKGKKDSKKSAQTGKKSNQSTAPKQQYKAEDYYKVQKGDTLFSIAFLNGIDYRSLALINNLDARNCVLYPGQKLIVSMGEIDQRNVYKVKQGDTMYSLSRKFGIPIDKLADNNHISEPYTLNAGQLLVINPGKPLFLPPSSAEKVHQKPYSGYSAPKLPPKEKPVEVASKGQASYDKTSHLSWLWPTSGLVISSFSQGSPGNTGVNIKGKRGQKIVAAADGKVVYAGSALRGYGKLIIIKHGDEYLSAYAHNDAILVKELQNVKAGQQIAKMGDTDSDVVNLHFEIRFRGKSVDPAKYLPKR